MPPSALPDGYLEWLQAVAQPIDVGLRIDRPFTLDGSLDNLDDIMDYDMSQTGTSQCFFVGPPPANEDWHITRLLLEAVDNNFNDATDYGAINNGLATGIALSAEDSIGTILYDFTPIRIQTSFDWSLYAGPDAFVQGGAGADALRVRWTFRKAGYDVVLEGARQMRLCLAKPDDLSSLEKHIAMVQGFKRLIPT